MIPRALPLIETTMLTYTSRNTLPLNLLDVSLRLSQLHNICADIDPQIERDKINTHYLRENTT